MKEIQTLTLHGFVLHGCDVFKSRRGNIPIFFHFNLFLLTVRRATAHGETNTYFENRQALAMPLVNAIRNSFQEILPASVSAVLAVSVTISAAASPFSVPVPAPSFPVPISAATSRATAPVMLVLLISVRCTIE